MASPLSGHITAFFLFDVAEGADLAAVRALLGPAGQSARLAPRPALPAYVRYLDPPVQADVEAFGVGAVGGMATRVKVYDYGVISLSLTRRFAGSWEELVAAGQVLSSAPLEAAAEAACRHVVARLRPALQQARDVYLSEDYFVYGVHAAPDGPPAAALVAAHGDDIARLLRGEVEALSPQERDEILRHRHSYLATDVVVPSWNGAFVYDTEAGLAGALEILEYANSQLLQFRYYDQLLDGELAGIYSQLQKREWRQNWAGRRYSRAARHVHSLFIDVNELTDRAENALKIAGDVYVARLFGMTAARIGLEQWRGNVREKLKTLDDIYRFAVEHAAMTRGELLEITIVLLIVLEIAMAVAGMM
jgi:hypothetical protein